MEEDKEKLITLGRMIEREFSSISDSDLSQFYRIIEISFDAGMSTLLHRLVLKTSKDWT